ncbi:hypothetical protein [uncultured Christiangramia sp.]|uniref:hypothetical protein n=1 Tax=uncultured Christiangramia sp. TaxID=503836 RepID=UPI002632C101|nr:hypothetical protein [uncultured Christiangramia sp.]
MKIELLIEEYKKQAKICSEIDYSNKMSVKKNNRAVKRMYQIVESISLKNNSNEKLRFYQLLDFEENKTKIWAAVQILEKLEVDSKTEKKALNIIECAAKGEDGNSLGFKYWLKNYKSKL